jgi:hypothetical protein
MRFVKPLDEKLVLALAARHRAIITIEENAIMGGAPDCLRPATRCARLSLRYDRRLLSRNRQRFHRLRFDFSVAFTKSGLVGTSLGDSSHVTWTG